MGMAAVQKYHTCHRLIVESRHDIGKQFCGEGSDNFPLVEPKLFFQPPKSTSKNNK